jgi:hypothetical protein
MGLNRCAFHSTKDEKEKAFADRENALAAARENAPYRLPLSVVLQALENPTSQVIAKTVLTSLEFYEYISEGLRTKSIPPTLLLRMMDYAEDWGKPVVVQSNGKEEVISEVRRVVVHAKESQETPEGPEIIN